MKSYPFAKLSVTGFPTIADLNNKWIFPLDVKVIVNVSGHDYPKEIASVLNSRGVKTYSFPLVEEGPDMGLENILSAISVLKEADAAGEKVILHCTCGNNRSRTVAEAFCYAKTGEHFADEYKGYQNHLVYNCETGHLPDLATLESLLKTV